MVQPAAFRGTLTQEQWLRLKTACSRQPLGERAKGNKHTFHSCSLLGLPIVRTQSELEFEPVNSVCTCTTKTAKQVNAFVAEPDSLCLAPKSLTVEGRPTSSTLLTSTNVPLAHACYDRHAHAHTQT